MKGRFVLRWAVVIYLVALIASWLLDKDHPLPLPLEGDWKEIPIDLSAEGGAGKHALLRYRKRPGTDGGRLPVLLIHGSPMASDSLDPLLRELPADRTYLVPDLPGFGYSRYGFTDYSFDGHADALRHLLEAEGLESVHLVAYSQGGGVALKLLSSAPEQIASLTLLSSIGVIEHELTGDYFLNQLLYSVQLFSLKLLDWGLPHFGLLDTFLLNVNYAENFYYSDMRPLRSILETVEVPALILHSRSDWLVPESTALEHYRILPQSLIYWGEGGHLMPMSRPKWVSSQLVDFFASVEDNTAPSRFQADGTRVLESARSSQAIGRTPSMVTLSITILALSLGTLISEDLTCITAGLLAARGLIPLLFAILACFLGIWIGDMLLYAIGRYGGGKLLHLWPFKKLISSMTIDSTRRWLNRRGGLAILMSRFMPGTRLALYLTAGLFRMNVFKMMFWLAFAGILWVFPVVGLVAHFGQRFSEWLIENSKLMLPGIVLFFLCSFLLSRLIAALLTYKGRRKLYAHFQRVKRWEFWPAYVFYIPVVFVLAWEFIRSRAPLAFTACNPGIPHSGLQGESKVAILEHLKPSGCVPRHLAISEKSVEKLQSVHDWMTAEALTFPIVLKPDQGERGKGVHILKNEAELEAELKKLKWDAIIQEYASGLEFGILYLRYPGDAKGSVISLNRKLMTSVEGDGQRTLEELILCDARAVFSYRHFFKAFKNRLQEIPKTGQHIVLADIGSHCRGALFLDGADLLTPELESEVDRIAKHFNGFYLGRFDVRCPSESDLKQGANLKVIELNGVTSEPAHIYHPDTPLRIGLKTVITQWRKAHEIGLMNSNKGAAVSSPLEIIKVLLRKN